MTRKAPLGLRHLQVTLEKKKPVTSTKKQVTSSRGAPFLFPIRSTMHSTSCTTPALFRQYHGTKTILYTSNETNCFEKRSHLDDYSLGAEKKVRPLKKNLSPGLSPFPPFVCMNSF